MPAQNLSRFEWLSRLLAPVDPAELHGLLCGLLCAGMDLDRDQWLLHAHEALADDREFSPEMDDLLAELFDENLTRIGHFDEPVTLLLPDDDAPFRQRIKALSDWCQGLLYGLGLGEIGQNDRLSEESREFLQDVADIAQVGFDTDEAGDEDETAYIEVVEYLRVGLLMIQQDSQPAYFRTH